MIATSLLCRHAWDAQNKKVLRPEMVLGTLPPTRFGSRHAGLITREKRVYVAMCSRSFRDPIVDICYIEQMRFVRFASKLLSVTSTRSPENNFLMDDHQNAYNLQEYVKYSRYSTNYLSFNERIRSLARLYFLLVQIRGIYINIRHL